MKSQALLSKLDAFRGALASRDAFEETYSWASYNRKVHLLLPAVLRIAEKFDPALVAPIQRNVGTTETILVTNAVDQLYGTVEQRDELDTLLGPAGPQLAAGTMHPWVWESAARLWDDGHRREAIQAAATHIDLQMQAKLERADVSGSELVTQAFTAAHPESGKPRLRLPNLTPGTDSWRSAHQGAMSFGQGCFLAIRNLSTHTLDQPEEQRALELLAALSVLARWIDEAEVQTS